MDTPHEELFQLFSFSPTKVFSPKPQEIRDLKESPGLYGSSSVVVVSKINDRYFCLPIVFDMENCVSLPTISSVYYTLHHFHQRRGKLSDHQFAKIKKVLKGRYSSEQ